MTQTTFSNSTKHFVAIDIGSNSFHLIIVREYINHAKVIFKQKQSIRLAAGLDRNNHINEQTLKSAMSCLKSFFAAFSHINNCQVSIVGTYALRQAKNKQQFLEQALQVIPHPIHIISGKREAELIFRGVVYIKTLFKPTLIIDIGGGSTEFIIGQQLTPQVARSLNIGCITLTQKFFASGGISVESMNDAVTYSKQALYNLAEQFNNLGWQKTLGTSGSMKTVTKIMHELYNDKKVTCHRLAHLQEQLIRWGNHSNIPLQNLSEKRRPLLAAAVAILVACFDLLKIEQLKYNAGGVREGLLYQLRFEQ